MSRKEEILNRLKISIETWNIELARFAAKQAIELGIEPSKQLERTGEGMVSISERFDEAKNFLRQDWQHPRRRSCFGSIRPGHKRISIQTKG